MAVVIRPPYVSKGTPYYQSVLANVNAQNAAAGQNRREAIQQALIRFGLVPEGFQDRYGDIDPATRTLAGENTATGISTQARLLEARKEAIRQFSRSLAARGLRRSGARGFGLRKRQLDYDRANTDALDELLAFIRGQYGTYAGVEQAGQGALTEALAQGGGIPGGLAFNPNIAVGGRITPDWRTFQPALTPRGPGNYLGPPVPPRRGLQEF